MKKKTFVSMVMAILMVFSFVLLPAGQAEAAKKKTVYVLTGINYITEDGKEMRIHTYSYNKKGMLKSGVRGHGTVKMKFTYDKKGRLKTFQNKLNEWQVRTYTYNKKGKISKVDTEYRDAASGKVLYDGFHSVYTYKKKKVVKEKASGTVYDEAQEKSVPVTYDIRYTYDKKGRLASKENKTTGDKVTITYDKKGSADKMVYKMSDLTSTIISRNTYNKKGLLTRMEEDYSDTLGEKEQNIYTYTYKKMKVKKSMVSKIKDQQKALLNQGLNFTIPDNDYAYGLY